MRHYTLILILFSGLFLHRAGGAAELDDVAISTDESLKIEANHNITRLKGFRSVNDNNKIYENEREKGLAEFLEDQEKWDLVRERGLREYRSQKRTTRINENSPEYAEYLRDKKTADQKYERSRQLQVSLRNRVAAQSSSIIAKLESEEQNLYLDRPRYELSKRSRNKWVGLSGRAPSPVSSGASSFNPADYQNLPQQPQVDFPAVSDFPPPPAPYEGYDEFAVPPAYDGNAPGAVYDPGYGADGMPAIPPPPPPPPDFDF